MVWKILSVSTAFAATLTLAPPAAGRPFTYTYKTKYAELDFSWSSEAAAIPALDKRLRAELAKEKADAIAGGKDDYAMRKIGWQTTMKVTTSGQSGRLISFSKDFWAFTGGAHGNGATTGILWDRQLREEISFNSLFSSPRSVSAQLRGPYCRALNAERKKRRDGEAKLGSIAEFDSCPKLSDLAIIPANPAHSGHFDRIHLIAAAYLAGPYSEGEYDIVLPVTGAIVRAMKPQYRSSFEAQRQ